MGLDITAYSNIMVDSTGADPDRDDNAFTVFVHPFFKERGKGLKHGAVYTTNDDYFRFRAGSYSGYNEWREALCNMVHDCPPEEIWENEDDYEGKPFYELINFADNEGAIGQEVSAKLARDFDEYREKAEKHLAERFREGYKCWHKAFKMAAENGAVIFR